MGKGDSRSGGYRGNGRSGQDGPYRGHQEDAKSDRGRGFSSGGCASGSRPKEKKHRKRSSSSSSSSSLAAKAERRAREARKVLQKHDEGFRQYLAQKEQQEQELLYKKQWELLAQALNSKFEESISASAKAGAQLATQARVKETAPVTPAEGAPVSSGFSAEQLKQIKSIFQELLPKTAPPLPVAPEASEEVEVAVATNPMKSSATGATLTPLQGAFVNSLFGNRVNVQLSDGLPEFQAKIKAAVWTQRPVVEATASFLSDHSEAQVPKGKDDRIHLFWTTLQSLN
eukprot:TRINITY_DN27182_c0_g1_i1.p1 TRINITY_DN27182_c0_g1~~TRINITY_DN27182_c0_g1_i1.p1  ORF type:complete len:303 (+),score=75.48 TRINITY_DN27182_c0_g1_i1:53-910(+)